MEKEVEGCRKLHNEELHNFYSSPNIIRVIKSGSMKWTMHAAHMRETRNAYTILIGKPEGRDHSENIGADEKITLEKILGKWDGVDCMRLAQARG